jgi:hypothetical protein
MLKVNRDIKIYFQSYEKLSENFLSQTAFFDNGKSAPMFRQN